MKKFMALMMSMMLVLSLAACGDTEDVAGDAAPVESVAEDVAESVEEEAVVDTDVEEEIASEEEADTISSLWDLANAEIIPDLAGTTWGFTGGCIDGVEMEQEDLDSTLEMYGGSLDLVFAEDGTVQMVQGAGAWDGTYEYAEDGITMDVDASGTALSYNGIFSMIGDQLVLILMDANNTDGLSGLYFVQ